MDKQLVALIDGNNFFVSCERLFRPDLAKRPVIVLSSNDGCVVARSQEVKDIGVPMGVPYFQIKDIIKDNDITCFSSNFALYRDLSRRLFTIVKRQVATFEQYSIDEGFFLLSSVGAYDFGVGLRDRIMRELGLPVSIGIASSKTLAKFAARRAKKGSGVEVLEMSDWEKLAPNVLLGELWGVGARRALAFRAASLVSARDVQELTLEQMRTLFGVEGARLWAELCGQMAYPVAVSTTQQESIMHSRSFGAGVTTKEVLMQAVFHHVQHAIDDLRRLGLVATKLSVFVGAGRSAGGGIRRTEILLGVPTDDPMMLVKQAEQAVARLYEAGYVYKRAGVTLHGLVLKAGLPRSLFATASDAPGGSDIGDVLDTIKARWGNDSLRIGIGASEQTWQSRRQSLSPAYTTRWSEIPTVTCQ